MKIPLAQSPSLTPSQTDRRINARRARQGLKLLRDDKIAQAVAVLDKIADNKKESAKELDGYLDRLTAWQQLQKDLMSL